jgi:alpha-galactosidase
MFFVPCHSSATSENASPAFLSWAATPPMGWNSWDCFATTVTEAQTRFAADYMAAHLAAHGWQYVVVDIQWYEPGADSFGYKAGAELAMDGYGRLQPALNRFPSSANGAGFKALADYVHSKGLKFGVHLMRGIPRKAVERNLPILGTPYHAKDIADLNRPCAWNPDMWGVDMKKPGAQAYYDSVFALLAQWGVDYVKVDDIARPYHDNEPEIEAVRTAIDSSGRAIVLSLSPGETALTAAEHVKRHANLWRISDDFWDSYGSLYDQFARLEKWNGVRTAGAWPDADMLPLGVLALGTRKSNFTPDEAVTLMTLWSIARSPLMFGGDMERIDDFTLSLLTNDAVLFVNQHSANNRPLPVAAPWKAWTADDPATGVKYLAVFNAPEPTPEEKEAAKAYGANVKIDPKAEKIMAKVFRVDVSELFGFAPVCAVDLWTGEAVEIDDGVIALEVPHHGARLVRLDVK